MSANVYGRIWASDLLPEVDEVVSLVDEEELKGRAAQVVASQVHLP